MTFILDFAIVLWMLAGLLCTLLPKIHGTLIIFAGAMVYGYITEFAAFGEWTTLTLMLLAGVSEIGGWLVRNQLTGRFPFSPEFGSNITVGNAGGIIASDILLGFLGLLLWQIAVGKNIFPRWDTISQILFRSSAAALLRFICGSAMILTFLVSVLF